MTSKDEARLKMYQSVTDFLAKNNEITQRLPDFAILYSLLQGNINSLMDLINKQSGDKSGITLTKKKERNEIVNRASALSGKIAAYATLVGNDILFQAIKHTKSEFEGKTDFQLAGLCQALCDEATPLLPELLNYFVKEEEITKLRQLCKDYLDIIPKPREVQLASRQCTQTIKKTILIADQILHKMDALIQIIRYSDAAFYDHYRGSRRIVELSRRSLTIRGLVQDIITKTGIRGALVSFEPGNGKGSEGTQLAVVQKKTALKGMFSISSLETGTYQVLASKEGYESHTQIVHVTNGELTHLNLELNPV
jgi:hypothetical protein